MVFGPRASSDQCQVAAFEGLARSERHGSAARLAITLKIRDCDAAMAADMLQFLDLVEANIGQWHYDKTVEMTVFDDAAPRATYRDLLRHVATVGQEQEELQKGLLRQSQQKRRL